ncbi:MAG: CsbD family protein [Candidatus Eisenbacteria bacterium]|uniref:CsbD family protein n=1 Tax=Eiseniibacteriota bacterium TaxID=2212470 RepID=A0A956ND11_UNCEI|nr:CsbD family protein [Candidatus Eisenbacteria bacterium]MCB9464570.1 CsbD family protein [Candidatus Eisenbacteria bacterium]
MHDPKWQGRWNQVRGKIKEQWGDLTDDDLTKIEGQRDQLVGRVQERYGKARDAAVSEVEAWERREGLR